MVAMISALFHLLRARYILGQVMVQCGVWCAVAGSVDAGKSSLVGVLTHGMDGRPLLDNGSGSARMNVFQHKHEIETGRTSSLSQQMLGYDEEGKLLYLPCQLVCFARLGLATSSRAKCMQPLTLFVMCQILHDTSWQHYSC